MAKFICILLACCVFCGSALADGNFKVGLILPLTGPLAEFGVAARNGVALAQKEHGELFRNIEFFYEDSQYDNNRALAGYQKLKSLNDISVVYVSGYGPSQALVPVAESQKFPILAVSADPSVTANTKYGICFGYRIEMIAEELLQQLRKRGAKNIGIVKTELAYMNGLIDAMKQNLKIGENIEVFSTFLVNDIDFRSTISKLRTKKFDSLGVFLIGDQISQFYKQSKQLDFQVSTFGTDAFDSMREVRAAQGTMTGAIFAAPFVSGDFVMRYVKAYGDDAQVSSAANAYEFAVLSAKLFGQAHGSLSGERIIEMYKGAARTQQGEVSKYILNESSGSSRLEFKVVGRQIERDRIVDVSN